MNIVWKCPDGSVRITTIFAEGVDPQEHARHLISTAMDEAARLGSKTFANDHYLTDEAVAFAAPIPPRDEFRNAMVWNGKRVVHDMDRARDIRREQLRRERAPVLAALDIEYQRADERGDGAAKKAIAARKQALRDITKHPALEAAKTLDDLRAVKVPA